MIDIRNNKEFLELSTKLLYEALTEGVTKNEFVSTYDFRGVGKTYTLINFARDNNYIVLVHNTEFARHLRYKYQYNEIYGKHENIRGRLEKVVFDEGVHYADIRPDKIATGFIS